MKISKQEDLKIHKEMADNAWNKCYQDAQNGNIDIELIVMCIDQCNLIDKKIIEFNHEKRKES